MKKSAPVISRQDVEDVLQSLCRAWNDETLGSFMAHYAHDVAVITEGGTSVVGMETIRDLLLEAYPYEERGVLILGLKDIPNVFQSSLRPNFLNAIVRCRLETPHTIVEETSVVTFELRGGELLIVHEILLSKSGLEALEEDISPPFPPFP